MSAVLHNAEALGVMRDLPGGSVDVILTDPPFSSGGRRENARTVRKSGPTNRRAATDGEGDHDDGHSDGYDAGYENGRNDEIKARS